MKKIYKLVMLLSVLLPFSAYSACNTVNGKSYGDCSHTSLDSRQQGYVKVTSNKHVTGMIRGATIYSGGFLKLSGISNGDISVNRGGKLIVNGIVNGVISNNGGTINVEGQASTINANSGFTTIGGIIGRVNGRGKIKYQNGAVVGGKPVK
ncbi:hypothetical protein CXF72_07675 [Psychromonas sp. MB-3u-54]|uniref:hypothetical protein n=1 Tax=Psychromonas sp. MB-3u-54 TaxID=2058319 RepID=UPI000C322324|nr:hypothetical protein [Psychromonas sp. MB-3u-54]PKH03193.1 hypothetical protein CXF72_07675 [Psychromonas sp. MB-3u-54]